MALKSASRHGGHRCQRAVASIRRSSGPRPSGSRPGRHHHRGCVQGPGAAPRHPARLGRGVPAAGTSGRAARRGRARGAGPPAAQVRVLEEEREIWKKPRPSSLGRRTGRGECVPVRGAGEGEPPGVDHVPAAGCLPQRLLGVAGTGAFRTVGGRRRADRPDPGGPRDEPRDLWGAPGPCRPRGDGRSPWPQAGGPAHACRGHHRVSTGAGTAPRPSAIPAPHLPRTCCTGTSGRPVPTGCGSPTSRHCPRPRASCTWRWSSMPGADAWWAGRWISPPHRRPVTRALDMAIGQRRPAAGLIHHSDHRPVRLADTCRGPCRGVRLARRVL